MTIFISDLAQPMRRWRIRPACGGYRDAIRRRALAIATLIREGDGSKLSDN